MKIIVGICHPKKVHFWRYIIQKLLKEGHEIKIVVLDKDVTFHLLKAYGLDYEVMGNNYNGMIQKAYGMFIIDFNLLRKSYKFNPDIFLGGGPYLAHVSRLMRKIHIDVDDTEHATINYCLSFPFSDLICTPSCYKGKINQKKQVTYNGFEELSYLHPNYFKQDSSVLDDLGLSKGEKFTVIRFVSWEATHDINQSGISENLKNKYVLELEKYGRVYISSERKLNDNLKKYKLEIAPEKMHSLLSYAQLYIGEGATMATEAGILGTPSIYISSLVGTMGNFDELENKYGLVFAFRDANIALEKAVQILKDNNGKNEWIKKKELLLKEKIDVTQFMVNIIKNYSKNYKSIKRNSNTWNVK